MLRSNGEIQGAVTNITDIASVENDPKGHARGEVVRRFIEGLPPGRLLDIGCYTGYITASFRGRHELHGIDIADKALAVAAERGFTVVHGDIELGLPYGDGSFDIVFMGETLEHCIRTDFVLSEVNRVLRIGGHLVITVPNVASLISIAMVTFNHHPFLGSGYRTGHVRDFTTRSLREALSNNGFRLIAMHGCEAALPGPMTALLRPIAVAIPRIASQLIALTEKTRDVRFNPEEEITIPDHVHQSFLQNVWKIISGR